LVELISIHVPKTGGTSFGSVLDDIYGRSNVFRDYSDRVLSPGSLVRENYSVWFKTDRVQTVRKVNTGRFRVVHGHFLLKKYSGLYSTARRVVWIRNPVDRLLSNYYYDRWRRGDIEPFEQYVLQENRINVFSEMLDDYTLNDLFFVGVTEFFFEDVSRLGTLLSWKKLSLGQSRYRRKESRNREYRVLTLAQGVRKMVEDLNCEDMDLYRATLELRKNYAPMD